MQTAMTFKKQTISATVHAVCYSLLLSHSGMLHQPTKEQLDQFLSQIRTNGVNLNVINVQAGFEQWKILTS